MKRTLITMAVILSVVCCTIVLNQTQAGPDKAATRPSAAATRIAVCDVAQILVQSHQARDLVLHLGAGDSYLFETRRREAGKNRMHHERWENGEGCSQVRSRCTDGLKETKGNCS